MKKVWFVGLDVHADTIAVAVAEPGGTVRSMGVIPNRPESIRRLVKQLGSAEQLHACYEAGPTGYVLYWQLTALGVRCEVVAPGPGCGSRMAHAFAAAPSIATTSGRMTSWRTGRMTVGR